MKALKVIDDEREIEVWINPQAVSMWRAHWTGALRTEHDHERTDVFFRGENEGITVRMSPAEFAVAWWAAVWEGGA